MVARIKLSLNFLFANSHATVVPFLDTAISLSSLLSSVGSTMLELPPSPREPASSLCPLK